MIAPANFCRAILGAVIDHHIIILRIVIDDLTDNTLNVGFFIVSRNQKHQFHEILLLLCRKIVALFTGAVALGQYLGNTFGPEQAEHLLIFSGTKGLPDHSACF